TAGVVEAVGGYQPDRRLALRKGDHAFEALGIDPVVGVDDLQVRGLRIDCGESAAVALVDIHEVFATPEVNSGIPACELTRNFRRTIIAAIVDDVVPPVRVGLAEDALGALHKKALAVVDGGGDRNEGLRRCVQAPTPIRVTRCVRST